MLEFGLNFDDNSWILPELCKQYTFLAHRKEPSLLSTRKIHMQALESCFESVLFSRLNFPMLLLFSVNKKLASISWGVRRVYYVPAAVSLFWEEKRGPIVSGRGCCFFMVAEFPFMATKLAIKTAPRQQF